MALALASAENNKVGATRSLLSTLGRIVKNVRKSGFVGRSQGGYGGYDDVGGYDDDSSSSGLGSLLGLLALLLAGLALLAALGGPLIALIGLGGNNGSLLTPTINGGTLSVLPTAVTGRRKRDVAGQVPQALVSMLTSLSESIEKYGKSS